VPFVLFGVIRDAQIMHIQWVHVVLGADEGQELHKPCVEEGDIVSIFKQDIGAMLRVVTWYFFH
jgi:hypothetical protein